MVTISTALSDLPDGLRDPLVTEYRNIIQSFLEQRWRPAELSGALFSEIVYTILDGQARGTYAVKPYKPSDFVGACRSLEKNVHVPRSFQILIPRMLPALYEIRNNRSVGHVGGDVDPNHMDSMAVLSMCNWIMGELIRVFHNVTIPDAQAVVDAIAEVRIPLIWAQGEVKRVLNPKLKLLDQILLLVATTVPSTTMIQLKQWTESANKSYFLKTLRKLHRNRLIEFNEKSGEVLILPPGATIAHELIRNSNFAGLP